MKLYHGSPNKLKVLKPKQGRGLTKFENQKAIFLTNSFDKAALYAISKSLKGKTSFGIIRNKLFIVGNFKLRLGYVYEVNVKAKKGPRGQYSYNEQIKKFKIKKVFPKDYKKKIIYVKNKKELMEKIK